MKNTLYDGWAWFTVKCIASDVRRFQVGAIYSANSRWLSDNGGLTIEVSGVFLSVETYECFLGSSARIKTSHATFILHGCEESYHCMKYRRGNCPCLLPDSEKQRL